MTGPDSPTEPIRFASQISLRQILLVIAGIAVGLGIWRFPHGQWEDIPLATLSIAICWSLVRQAFADYASLAALSNLNRKQRVGYRFVISTRLVVAAML